MAQTTAHRLLAIVTSDPLGSESLREIQAEKAGNGSEGIDLRVVVPAVEANPLRHTLGDIDEPRQEAGARLKRVLEELRENGIEAGGEVGDPDPIQAAQDALLKAPADEHVVDIETAGRGTHDPAEGHEVGTAYLPGLSRADFSGMVAGIFGTIVAAVLAAAVTADNGSVSGRAAAAILIAIGIALVNMAHVVGLTLMESVRYRGGFAKFFRYLSLIGTPLAVLINLILLLS
jgi:hypothetical protein